MSKENPLWGAPRIHGELLKLGFEIAELRSFDHVVGAGDERRTHVEPEPKIPATFAVPVTVTPGRF